MAKVETIVDLRQWGNDLALHLPVAVAHAAHLHANQRVKISVEGGRVIITSLPDTSLTLEQRIAKYHRAKHGGEVMVSEPIGSEKG